MHYDPSLKHADMEPTYTGKTKDVYDMGGYVRLVYKDDATGKDGVFDPGQNQVGLSISGLGNGSLRTSVLLFKEIEELGFHTHMLGYNFEENYMDVKKVRPLDGRNNLEWVCRIRADGGFIRRFGITDKGTGYCKKGDNLGYLVEVNPKDDDRDDPPINKMALVHMGIIPPGLFDYCEELTQDLTENLERILKKKGLILYDLKYEFGLWEDEDGNTHIVIIDELSPGIMRCYDLHTGEQVKDPIILAQRIMD